MYGESWCEIAGYKIWVALEYDFYHQYISRWNSWVDADKMNGCTLSESEHILGFTLYFRITSNNSSRYVYHPIYLDCDTLLQFIQLLEMHIQYVFLVTQLLHCYAGVYPYIVI